MDDLISRQAVKELAHNQMREKYCGMALKKQRDFYIKLADSIIDLLPSIQPKRGKWIHHPEIGWGETWLCDQCGEKTTSTVMGNPRANFCPNCGADMRGEKHGL